jgi:hypothetical protein
MNEQRSHTGMCSHSVSDPKNTLIVESHWAGLMRIRCTICGGTAPVRKAGEITPDTCECHSFRTDETDVAGGAK